MDPDKLGTFRKQLLALKAELVSIGAALKRIDAGGFGECFICGEPLDLRRLSIDPTTTRCVDG